MSPVSALAAYQPPIQPVAGVVGRQPSEPDAGSGQSRFQASDSHSHGELASACPTCGRTLNLSV